MRIEDISAESAPVEALSNQTTTGQRRVRAFFHIALVAAGAATVWIVTWLAIARSADLGTVVLGLIIPTACAALFGLAVLRQDHKWVWPVKELERLLPSIRAGELPVDSINSVRGGLQGVAAEVRSLLLDLRQQKVKVAELELETRQRVANRTDALERTIGSLRQQATRDALTGLFNRRMLDQYLPDQIDKCNGDRRNLAVMMIDVDYFKTLNDTLGHAAGDELLRNIGQIIRSGIREQDAAFRCGGDEFVVVLPGCNEENATLLAARMTTLVAGLTSTMRLPQSPGLSIGIATLHQLRNASVSALLALADKKLYETKIARKGLAKAG